MTVLNVSRDRDSVTIVTDSGAWQTAHKEAPAPLVPTSKAILLPHLRACVAMRGTPLLLGGLVTGLLVMGGDSDAIAKELPRVLDAQFESIRRAIGAEIPPKQEISIAFYSPLASGMKAVCAVKTELAIGFAIREIEKNMFSPGEPVAEIADRYEPERDGVATARMQIEWGTRTYGWGFGGDIVVTHLTARHAEQTRVPLREG